MIANKIFDFLENSFSYQKKKLNIARQRARAVQPLLNHFTIRLYVFLPNFQGKVLGFGLAGQKNSEWSNCNRADKVGYHLRLKIPLRRNAYSVYYDIRNTIFAGIWLAWILVISLRIRRGSFCLFSSPSCVTSRFLALLVQHRGGTASLVEHGGERRFFEDSTHWLFINSAFSKYVYMTRTDIPEISLRPGQPHPRILFVLPSYLDHAPVPEDERPSYEKELASISHFTALCNENGRIPTLKLHPKGGFVSNYLKNYFDSRDLKVLYQSDQAFFESDIFIFFYCGSLWIELLNKGCRTLYIDSGIRLLSDLGRVLFADTSNYLQMTESLRDRQFVEFISTRDSSDELYSRFKKIY